MFKWNASHLLIVQAVPRAAKIKRRGQFIRTQNLTKEILVTKNGNKKHISPHPSGIRPIIFKISQRVNTNYMYL